MADNRDIWVFSEKSTLLAELTAGARSLAAQTGGKTVALVIGTRTDAEAAFRLGAERVLWPGELRQGSLVEDVVPSLLDAIGKYQPFAILIGATVRGRAISGRLAARLGTAALTDVLDFTVHVEGLEARHLVFGGGAVRIDSPTASPIIATVGTGVFEPLSEQRDGPGEIEPIPWIDPPWQAKLVERRKRDSSSVNLSAAKRVVCPGRGVKQQEDLGLIEELARALNAEIACTRPLAEGLNWLPRERYIGISGAMIKPDLYIGIGVSGQAQHTIGMSESRVVVAINKDRNAPLVAQSDYAIEGDLYAVVPALIQAVKAIKGN